MSEFNLQSLGFTKLAGGTAPAGECVLVWPGEHRGRVVGGNPELFRHYLVPASAQRQIRRVNAANIMTVKRYGKCFIVPAPYCKCSS